MLIDGGKSNQSDKIYAILKERGITYLDYIVATHPDDDHIGGLAGALNYASAGTAFSPVEEDDILRLNEDLSCTVLKVGHHGSAASTGDEFLAAVDPAAAVISCGKGNEYGHPTGEVLEKLQERGILVFRTDLQGDIRFYESGGELFYEVSRNPDADVFTPGLTQETTRRSAPPQKTDGTEDAAASDETAADRNSSDTGTPERNELDYIVNTNTGKFHYPGCRGVKQMKEKNKHYVTCDRQDLTDQGYDPCGICHP